MVCVASGPVLTEDEIIRMKRNIDDVAMLVDLIVVLALNTE